MAGKYLLYFDDTGSRDPDHTPPETRHDRMDWFGLGGILVKEEDVNGILKQHQAFCAKWSIDYPLHSSRIRGGHGKFGWLKNPEKAGIFLPELQEFLLALPFVAIACIIDRPGYLVRYKDTYDDCLRYMCRTVFCILIERAVKFVEAQNRKLEVYFEQSGKREDRELIQYMRKLKQDGPPFASQTSQGYQPLQAADYKRLVLGEPRRKTKKAPMIQLADLVLYPIAKGGYDPYYRPYRLLKEGGKLIDSLLPEEQISLRGIKYSCFLAHND